MNRRRFLGAALGAAAWTGLPVRGATAPLLGTEEAEQLRRKIDEHRPSRGGLPADLPARFGAAHVAGKYHLTDKPFLIEGAERLLNLGTKLGKFWFIPESIQSSYPFNSRWGRYVNFVELAKSEHFEALFELPFATFILEAHSPVENGWQRDQAVEFYARIEEEFRAFTVHLYERLAQKRCTVILQHWEGDWLLRGRGGERWTPPPADWKARCERMQRWLEARQAGVSKGRSRAEAGKACRILHAAEVNRVVDLWNGIPTMTEHVLPGVALDMVSYSCYDALSDGVTLYRALDEIRRRGQWTGAGGNRPVFVGEIGLPENEQPHDIEGRWDGWLGAIFAAEAPFIAQWELYCNELAHRREGEPAPAVPVRNATDVRGFWLVRPDGSLSRTGEYMRGLWEGQVRSDRTR